MAASAGANHPLLLMTSTIACTQSQRFPAYKLEMKCKANRASPKTIQFQFG